MSFHRKLLAGWTGIAGRFGAVQTLVMLGLFYVVLLGPVALFMAVARQDQLSKRGLGQGPTAWNDADSAPPDLERAKLTT